jgi:hypothetical protein
LWRSMLRDRRKQRSMGAAMVVSRRMVCNLNS